MRNYALAILSLTFILLSCKRVGFERLNKVPNNFIGVYYEVSDEVILGQRTPDTVHIIENRFKLIRGKELVDETLGSIALLNERQRQTITRLDSLRRITNRKIDSLVRPIDFHITKIHRIKSNQDDVVIFCGMLNSDYTSEYRYELIWLDGFLNIYEISSIGYDGEDEFIHIGKFTKNEYSK